jgi:hypothetical protein
MVPTEVGPGAGSASHLINPEGDIVVAQLNDAAFNKWAKKSSQLAGSLDDTALFSAAFDLQSEWEQQNGINSSGSKIEPWIPSNLRCHICKGLARTAVRLPCCKTLFCDDCLRASLQNQVNESTPSQTNGISSSMMKCPQCDASTDLDKMVVDKPSRALVDQQIRRIGEELKRRQVGVTNEELSSSDEAVPEIAPGVKCQNPVERDRRYRRAYDDRFDRRRSVSPYHDRYGQRESDRDHRRRSSVERWHRGSDEPRLDRPEGNRSPEIVKEERRTHRDEHIRERRREHSTEDKRGREHSREKAEYHSKEVKRRREHSRDHHHREDKRRRESSREKHQDRSNDDQRRREHSREESREDKRKREESRDRRRDPSRDLSRQGKRSHAASKDDHRHSRVSSKERRRSHRDDKEHTRSQASSKEAKKSRSSSKEKKKAKDGKKSSKEGRKSRTSSKEGCRVRGSSKGRKSRDSSKERKRSRKSSRRSSPESGSRRPSKSTISTPSSIHLSFE